MTIPQQVQCLTSNKQPKRPVKKKRDKASKTLQTSRVDVLSAKYTSQQDLIDALTIFGFGGSAGAFTCDCDIVAAEHV